MSANIAALGAHTALKISVAQESGLCYYGSVKIKIKGGLMTGESERDNHLGYDRSKATVRAVPPHV